MLENRNPTDFDIRANAISDCPGSMVPKTINEEMPGYGQLHGELLAELKKRFSLRK